MRGTKPLQPMSNWHRMLTMLDLNGGTLSPAQMYKNRKSTIDNHPEINIGKHTRKMSTVAALAPRSYAYEHRAEKMGLVTIQKYKNRKWVVLLPKGEDILRSFLDRGIEWVPDVKI